MLSGLSKPAPGAAQRAFFLALSKTFPILAGFAFVGFSYGVYMNSEGFSFWYPMLMSLTVFGGSLEFVIVTMLLGSFNPVQTVLMALMIQARHLFYGISMLERYNNTGWKKLYLIFGMCDETFSINYSADLPQDTDRNWFMFFVTLLNHLYWVLSATIGGLAGSLLKFDTSGIEFVMTAMFVVIFLEQLLKEKNHVSAIVGVVSAAVCLIAFGAQTFLLPTMACILLLLTALRRPVEKAGGAE